MIWLNWILETIIHYLTFSDPIQHYLHSILITANPLQFNGEFHRKDTITNPPVRSGEYNHTFTMLGLLNSIGMIEASKLAMVNEPIQSIWRADLFPSYRRLSMKEKRLSVAVASNDYFI